MQNACMPVWYVRTLAQGDVQHSNFITGNDEMTRKLLCKFLNKSIVCINNIIHREDFKAEDTLQNNIISDETFCIGNKLVCGAIVEK